MLQHRGYIYTAKHEGWYSVSDETFYPQSQVHLSLDPATGRKRMVKPPTLYHDCRLTGSGFYRIGEGSRVVLRDELPFSLVSFSRSLIRTVQNGVHHTRALRWGCGEIGLLRTVGFVDFAAS